MSDEDKKLLSDRAIEINGFWRAFWKGTLLKPKFSDRTSTEEFLEELQRVEILVYFSR